MEKGPVWIGTSWKMNKTLAEAQSFARALRAAQVDCDPRIQSFLVPSFTNLREVKRVLSATSVLVGAQNMHWESEGAWTGEVSAPMLTDCGADLVELGHSERRMHFGETDETVGLKTATALRHGLMPLVCIGETRAEREAGQVRDVLSRQIARAFAHLSDTERKRPILLAYEPVWAIGSGGIPATPAYVDARQADIATMTDDLLGRKVPCLYGGSVTSENCSEFLSCPHIDGLFIGRAAWSVEGYIDILRRCASVL